LEVFLKLLPRQFAFLQSLDFLEVFPPNGSSSIQVDNNNPFLSVLGVIMYPKLLLHTKQPCLELFSLINFSIEGRRLNLLEFLSQITLRIIPLFLLRDT
jgi:hypothetical protein